MNNWVQFIMIENQSKQTINYNCSKFVTQIGDAFMEKIFL